MSDDDDKQQSADGEPSTPAAKHKTARQWLKMTFFGSETRTVGTMGFIGAVMVSVVLAVVFSSGGGGSKPVIIKGTPTALGWTPPAAPASIGSEDDLERYVLSRLIWRVHPSVYKESVGIAFNQYADNGGPHVAEVDERGNATAYSIPELNAEGASLAGHIVYVVGRLASRTTSPTSAYDWTTGTLTDIELSGPHGGSRVYGLLGEGPGAHTGEVVFFRAVVAAVGPGSGTQSLTYVIGLEAANGGWQASGAPNIRDRLEQFGRSALELP